MILMWNFIFHFQGVNCGLIIV